MSADTAWRSIPRRCGRIAAEGHEIGLHSEKHDYMQKMDYEAVLDDLTRCRAEVAECCGTQARLFRPPGGLYSETVLRASSKLDLSLILWSVDPEDWDVKGGERAPDDPKGSISGQRHPDARSARKLGGRGADSD
ncbi:MAG: polysaccharide deacetylase family protein [Oscillospiraceae bacterium]